jgi:hypothetical protein
MLAACGGDDDDDASASASESGSGTEAGTAGADICETNTELNTALYTLFDSEDPDAVKAAYEEAGVEELIDTFEANAPAEIADVVAEGADAVRAVGETGDVSSLEEHDGAPISAYVYENCDITTADVSATDFAFAGIPSELPAGPVSFKFTNDGAEEHEIIVVRKNDGVTESWDELLALPEEETDAKVAFVTATGGAPGDTAYAEGILEPGEHIAVCFVPQGSMDGAEGSGPPHAMVGMTTEFTVS